MTRRTGTSSIVLLTLFFKFLLWMHGKTPWRWNMGEFDGDNLPLKLCVVFAVGASSQKETAHFHNERNFQQSADCWWRGIFDSRGAQGNMSRPVGLTWIWKNPKKSWSHLKLVDSLGVLGKESAPLEEYSLLSCVLQTYFWLVRH